MSNKLTFADLHKVVEFMKEDRVQEAPPEQVNLKNLWSIYKDENGCRYDMVQGGRKCRTCKKPATRQLFVHMAGRRRFYCNQCEESDPIAISCAQEDAKQHRPNRWEVVSWSVDAKPLRVSQKLDPNNFGLFLK